ncbi:MAG TPA: NAD(P)-dependent oxidoreductase [Gammaproteobacteria bacterium]|nr:NAD(P)-dependent oxidoreductase [Gammaproteobacteria bacterium]
MTTLKNKVIFITGASRGIGRALALRFAGEGANIVITGKTVEAQPNLEGTIHTVADEVRALSVQALPIMLDVRDEDSVMNAVEETVKVFGGIDVLINNASAINMSSILELPMKRYDLLMNVNVRATYLCSKACIPYLKKSENPHILTMSPPLSLNPKWFKKHLAYTLSKFGMSMCTLGLSEDLKRDGIAVNSLWPRTLIATAAIANNFPKAMYEASRKPDIVSDAALAIITSPSRELTGHFFIDEDFLKSRGVTDFSVYALREGVALMPDLYLE